jgi:hypothetical protein
LLDQGAIDHREGKRLKSGDRREKDTQKRPAGSGLLSNLPTGRAIESDALMADR